MGSEWYMMCGGMYCIGMEYDVDCGYDGVLGVSAYMLEDSYGKRLVWSMRDGNGAWTYRSAFRLMI